MSPYEKLLERVRNLLKNVPQPCQVSVFLWAFKLAAHEQFLPESSYKPFFKDMLKQLQKEGIIAIEKKRKESKEKLTRKQAWGHQSWLLKYDNN